MQGGALGALLTFAERSWYTAHVKTAPLWPLTPLSDQHIAGAVTWVLGGLAYQSGLVLAMLLWLRAAERCVTAAEQALRPPICNSTAVTGNGTDVPIRGGVATC